MELSASTRCRRRRGSDAFLYCHLVSSCALRHLVLECLNSVHSSRSRERFVVCSCSAYCQRQDRFLGSLRAVLGRGDDIPFPLAFGYCPDYRDDLTSYCPKKDAGSG